MLYNDLISYNQSGVSFNGSLKISAPGLSAPIIIGDINIFFSSEIDYSHSSTIGVVTVTYAQSGLVSYEMLDQLGSALVSYSIAEAGSEAQLSIETDDQTAIAIANATKINVNSYSEISIEY